MRCGHMRLDEVRGDGGDDVKRGGVRPHEEGWDEMR